MNTKNLLKIFLCQLFLVPIIWTVDYTLIDTIIGETINEKIDPCDNFYQFSCGKWIEDKVLNKNENITARIYDSFYEYFNVFYYEHLSGKRALDSNAMNILKFAFKLCLIDKLKPNNKEMDDYDLEYTYYMCTFELKEVTSFAFQTTILNCLFGYIDITKSHNTIYEMFHLIKEAFRKLLYEKEWIDVKSRIKTFEKLRLMKFFFNYDGDLYSTITMDKVYGNLFLAPDDNFNVARTKMNMFMISANSANPKLFNVDVDPLELNAAYEVNENMFKAYIGLLRKPTYDNEFLTSMKYGGYGSIIGHEIIHGFSEEGLSYNGKKENVNIFSDYSLEEYNKRKKCILSQYSNHVESISKINVNGKLTLSENIADNGGIKIAYNAYKKYSEKYGSEKNESPRFNKYSNEQLFFISFAQSMCRKMNSAGGKDTIENDDHSPSEARVLLTLGNYKEFSNAFNCPVGSRMNPSSRCEVWKFNN